MNKKEKKPKKKAKKRSDEEGTNDGLKQSKLEFKKRQREEDASESEDKSISNSAEKIPLLEENNLKNGSKTKSSKTKEKPKKKRGRPKSVDKEKKSKSKSKSKSKPKKTKIKKGVDYQKGKYNIRVELIENDENLEGEEDDVDNSCCVVCSNRNCVRAALTKNYKLMQKCINDREHISTLVNPYSISIKSAIEIAIKNKDKKIIEMIFESWNDDNNEKLNLKPRCYIEKPKITLVETGENSQYMVGVKTRKLNQTRGNKMGNDAFIRDDVQMNDVVNVICKTIAEECDDPSFINFFKSMEYNNSNDNFGNDNKF